MTEFTILMPCLNEAEAIGGCIREAKAALEKFGLDGEILIADNGSMDESVSIARREGARVVSIPERGYGAAILGGIRAARGTYVILGDGDGSYDFSETGPLAKALREGYDLVVGNRFRGRIEPGAMPFSHRLGAPLLSALARLRFRAPVGDFHCGLRGFHREKALALGLSCPGMEFATELIARFAKSGGRITELPATLRGRGGGSSHLRSLRDGLRHLYFIAFFSSPARRKNI